MPDPTPAETHAVVVGIERYSAGADWNLDGPASDAVRFAEYLGARGVRRENIWAYIAPLPANGALMARMQAAATVAGEPIQAVLDDVVEEQIRSLNAGLFLFFWAGHGLITVEDERRLFTTDATPETKRNLDLTRLMAALRTDRYPHLNRQAIVVDSCANYIVKPATNLMHRTYPTGGGVTGREQFALYAASPGEYAKNLTDEKSGLMSRELIALLKEQAEEGTWPPDFTRLADRLAARFIALRRENKSRQTPASFWFRSPHRDGHYLSKFKTAGMVPQRRQKKLTTDDYNRLLEAVLNIESMLEAQTRNAIVRRLRPEISTTIRRHPADRIDVIAIIDRCFEYHAIGELVTCIDQFEAESGSMQELREVIETLFPDENGAESS